MSNRKGVLISREVYEFLMGEGPLEGAWFGDMNEGFKGAFWWRALLRCAAGWPAKADRSAQRQDPQGLGPKGESGGRAAICPNDTGV